MVYDITKDKSFDNITKWIDDLKEEADPDLVIYIIGNKLDLVEKNPQTRLNINKYNRKVPTESG